MGGFTPISSDEFWASLEQTAPTRPTVRTPEEVASAAPYTNLPEGTRVWTEEELQESTVPSGGLMGLAQRALDADALISRSIHNPVSDALGMRGGSNKPAASPLSVWAGLGHQDPTTGQVTGQATFAPGHGTLGDKLEAFVAGGRGEAGGIDPAISAMPGGVLFDMLPEDLKKLPRAILDPIIRTGSQLVGGILESPSSMLASLGGKLAAKEASKAGTRKAYLASELAQKAAGGTFVAKGVGDAATEAKTAFEKGDIEGAVRAGAHAVSQILLGGLLVKGGIDDAKFAKGLPEEVPATPAKPATPAPAKPTASAMGEYPDPSAIAPPPRPAGPGDYPDPSEYLSTPPTRVPKPPRPTYNGQVVTVVSKQPTKGKVTIQLSDGTKKRVTVAKLQGYSAPERVVTDEEAAAAIAERDKPAPGYEQDPTPERVAEAMQPPPKQGIPDEDDLDSILNELESENMTVVPAGRRLSPQQALDFVWDTVSKGREKATSKMRTFGGIFSPREAEGADLRLKNKPKLVVSDKTKAVSFKTDSNELHINPESLERLMNTAGKASDEEVNRTLLDIITHEITHKIRPTGLAFDPITGKQTGRLNPSGGHAMGGLTDSPLQDVELLRTQSRLGRMVRARAAKGGAITPTTATRIRDASFSGEPLGMAKEFYGGRAVADTSPSRKPTTKPGEVTPSARNVQMALEKKDYTSMAAGKLKEVFDTQFRLLVQSGTPSGTAIRQIMDEVRSASGGKLPANAKTALKDLVLKEKSIKAGKPVDVDEARTILTAAAEKNVAGNFDVRDTIKDLARIQDPQKLPKDLYDKYREVRIRVSQRLLRARQRLSAAGRTDPRVEEAVERYNNLPRLKTGRPEGGMADPALKEALTPPPVKKAEAPPKAAPTVRAEGPTQRQLEINPRKLGASGRQTGPGAPGAEAGLIADAAGANRRWNELRSATPSPENLAARREFAVQARQLATNYEKAVAKAQEILARTGAQAPPRLQRLLNSIIQLRDVAKAADDSIAKAERPVGKGRTTSIEQKLQAMKEEAPPKKPPMAAADDEEIPLDDFADITLEPAQKAALAKVADDPTIPEDIRRRAGAAVVRGTPQDVTPRPLRKIKGITAKARARIIAEERAKVGTDTGKKDEQGNPILYTEADARSAIKRRVKSNLLMGRPSRYSTKKAEAYGAKQRLAPPVATGQRFKDSPEGYVTKGKDTGEVEAEGRLVEGEAERILRLAEENKKTVPPTSRVGSLTAVSQLDVAKRRREAMARRAAAAVPRAPGAPAPKSRDISVRLAKEVKKRYPLTAPPPSDSGRAVLRAKPYESLAGPSPEKRQLTDVGDREVTTGRRFKPYSKAKQKFLSTGNFYRTALDSAQSAIAALRRAAAKGGSIDDINNALRTGVKKIDRVLIIEDLRAGRSIDEITDRLKAKAEWATKRLAAGKGALPPLKPGEGRQLPFGGRTPWTYDEFRKQANLPPLDTNKPIKVLDDSGKEAGEIDISKGTLTRPDGTVVDLVNKRVNRMKGSKETGDLREDSGIYGMPITRYTFERAVRLGGAAKNFVLRDETGAPIRMVLPGIEGKSVHAVGGAVIDPETKEILGGREGKSEAEPKIPHARPGRKGSARLLADDDVDISESYQDALSELPESVRKRQEALDAASETKFTTEQEQEAIRAARTRRQTFSGESTRRRRMVEKAGGASSALRDSVLSPAELYSKPGGYEDDPIITKRTEPVYEDRKRGTAGEAAAGARVQASRVEVELDKEGKPIISRSPVKPRPGMREIREGPTRRREYTRAITEEEMEARSQIGGQRDSTLGEMDALARTKPGAPRLAPKPTEVIDPKRVFRGKTIKKSAIDPQHKTLRTYLDDAPGAPISLRHLAVAVGRDKITPNEYTKLVTELFDHAVKTGVHRPSQKKAFLQAAQRELNKFVPLRKTAKISPLRGENRDAWFARRVREESEKITPPPKDKGEVEDEGFEDIDIEPATSPSATRPVTATTGARQMPLFSNLPEGVDPPPVKGPAKAVYDRIGRAFSTTIEESNALRALASSGDFSAPFRQAIVYTFAHPVKAAKRSREMVRAWTERNHKALERKMHLDPDFKEASEAGANFVHATGEHEAFHGAPLIQRHLKKLGTIGRGVSNIVAGSERSYTYYQNAALLDVYKAGKEFLKSTGEWNANSSKELAKFANDAVSRTKIPLGEGANKVLTGIFFSPQMQASRAKILTDPFGLRYNTKVGKFARKELARAMATGLALMTSTYATADAAGLNPTMEWDPRSSDFGKVRIGNSTVDVWGGYQQLVRATAQFLSGEYKSVSSGRAQKRDRLDTLVQFVRSKLAPAPSLALTLTTGKDMIGREAVSWEGRARAIGNSAAPMAGRDLVELYKENPAIALAAAVPLLMGMNINAGLGRKGSYVDSPSIRESDQRVSDEVRRLKLMPPSLSRRVSLPGKNRIGQKYYTTLKNKDWEDFEKEAMPEVVELLDKFIASPAYKKLDDKAKTRALASRIRWVNRFKGANYQKRKEVIERFRKGLIKPSNEWWSDDEE